MSTRTDSWPEIHIIRANAGMIRACWFEPDKQAKDMMIFVIRQTKYNSDDSTAIVKEIRLLPDELQGMIGYIGKISTGDPQK